MMPSKALPQRGMRLSLWAGACCLLLLAACKPTEQNYRQAYEKTIAGREAAAEDSTIYQNVRKNMQREVGTVDVGARVAPVISAFVAITENGGGTASSLHRYCVVAGQFKQVFNARSMRERLAENGYPDSFVVQTGEPYYYVIAGSYDTLQETIPTLNKLQTDAALKLKEPMPMLLQPAQIR